MDAVKNMYYHKFSQGNHGSIHGLLIESISKGVFFNGMLHLITIEYVVAAVDAEGNTWRIIPMPHKILVGSFLCHAMRILLSLILMLDSLICLRGGCILQIPMIMMPVKFHSGFLRTRALKKGS